MFLWNNNSFKLLYRQTVRVEFSGTEMAIYSFAELSRWGLMGILGKPEQFRFVAFASYAHSSNFHSTIWIMGEEMEEKTGDSLTSIGCNPFLALLFDTPLLYSRRLELLGSLTNQHQLDLPVNHRLCSAKVLPPASHCPYVVFRHHLQAKRSQWASSYPPFFSSALVLTSTGLYL